MMESSGSETEERLDESLLEPLSEVSYNEREKNYGTDGLPANVLTDDKVTKKSLPDARAKVLRLQRVQRIDESNSSSSSNESTKSSKNKNAPTAASAAAEKAPNADEEKEETVNLSLDSIIRRGLIEQKLHTNFNNPFKFGKPDDNISLRCNPSANLFYSQQSSSSDSESGSWESEKRPQQTAASDDEDVENEQKPPVVGSNGSGAPQKRKRGRPKMTDEEKAAKRARNQSLLQAQAINNQSVDAMATPVDELMAMGHSLFSEYAPKKRGRRRKDQLQNFYNANDSIVSMETDHSQNNNDSAQFADVPPKKKRGRKPKVHDESLNAFSDGQLNSTVGSNHHEGAPERMKRGRKPKYANTENYYVKLDEQNQPEATEYSDGGATSTPLVDPNQPQKKKRGRKPRSFYLEQQQQLLANQGVNDLNRTAPADMEVSGHRPEPYEKGAAAQLNGMHEHFASLRGKKGRKPQGYREWLLQQQEIEMANASAQSNNTLDHSYVSTANTSAFSDVLTPIVYKKRGRKPKAYYEALQRQQEAINREQSTPNNYPTNNSTSFDTTEVETTGPGGILTKRVSKPSVKQDQSNKRVMFQDQGSQVSESGRVYISLQFLNRSTWCHISG